MRVGNFCTLQELIFASITEDRVWIYFCDFTQVVPLNTVKSHVKAQGFNNFIRVLGGLINGGLISGGGGHISGMEKNVSERRNKVHLRNELKQTYHYI